MSISPKIPIFALGLDLFHPLHISEALCLILYVKSVGNWSQKARWTVIVSTRMRGAVISTSAFTGFCYNDYISGVLFAFVCSNGK